jgi:FAD-dependent urate hydroxylase
MAKPDSNILVIGAGPYGLAATIHLRRASESVDIIGAPMSSWKSMPTGMLLRSNWGATSMVERVGDLSLDRFVTVTAREGVHEPVPLEDFVRYGEWVQETAVPDVEDASVASIDRHDSGFLVRLASGETRTARRVVMACGIGPFAHRPAPFDAVSDAGVSHTSEHRDLSVFAGRDLAIVGGGQSALESAALAAEAGARVEIIVRSTHLNWLRGHSVKSRLGSLGPIVYAPTDVGPLWYSRLVSEPDAFRRLPTAAQTRIARRCIRPAGAHWLQPRIATARLSLGRTVEQVAPSNGRIELQLDDGSRRDVDHVLLGTGYRVDLRRYEMLSPRLVQEVRSIDGYPILVDGFESSVPGLHFVGAPAAPSFGPIMRFVSGTWFAGRELAAHMRSRRAGASLPTGRVT